MVVTRRRTRMDSEKNKNSNGVKRTAGAEKSRMKSCSISENDGSHSESEDEHSSKAPRPPGLAGSSSSSIKVTLKKKSSNSSSSSRESAQSFEVVKSVPPAAESASTSSDEDQKEDSDNEKSFEKQNSFNDDDDDDDDDDEDEDAVDNAVDVAVNDENGKESEAESETDNESCDSDIEIVEGPIQKPPAMRANVDNMKDGRQVKRVGNILSNSVKHCKTEEVSQNSAVKKEERVVKNEEKVVKNEDKDDLKYILQNDVLVLKNDEVKDLKEQKEYKLNVRSFDDLAAPRTVNLINMPPPSQIDRPSSFISQNGTSYPQYMNMSCDICASQFDSLELLNEHKKVMKHYKCTFKECNVLVLSSHQEFLDHQRVVHNIMPSPVQQLAHQVQCLPTMGFDQQLQSGVPPMPENLRPPGGVPNMYTQTLRIPNQVPMQRPMRPMGRPSLNLMMGGNPTRGRNMSRGPRGRPVTMGSPMMRGGTPMKRPLSTTSLRHQTPPLKRVATDRNSFTNNMNKNSPTIVKSLSESITKSITAANKSQASPTQQDVVNLFSKRGLTISTVDTVNNISIPAGLSLNSAVSIIPTSPAKVPSSKKPHELPNKVSQGPSSVVHKTVDTVDLTGPDKPKKYWPCEICSKTYLNVETLYEHVSIVHKSVLLSYRCNLCSLSFPTGEVLGRHRQGFHKTETTSNSPFVIPIMDLGKSGAHARLQSMGVINYLPVVQLDHQGGQFGVPLMSTARPGSMEGLKFNNFFNLGCIRKL